MTTNSNRVLLREAPHAESHILDADHHASVEIPEEIAEIADPQLIPVARTVMALVRTEAGAELPLVVVHSHGHRDHIAGDQQFASLDRAARRAGRDRLSLSSKGAATGAAQGCAV